jgi:branched-chain amino acid transport system substrate-binding protein
MRRRSALAGLVAALLALAVLAACSNGPASPSPTTTGSASASSSPSPSASTAPNVAEIAVLASDTGPLGSTGQSVRAAVELAVEQANLDELVPGWSFEVVAANDRSKQSVGQQAASGIAASRPMIGVVGTLRSTIDEGVQPILNTAGIPMVSPAGTAIQLTRRLGPAGVVRPFPTYFRLSPTDADQGPAAARFTSRTLEATRVAVLSDGSSYGRLLADGFAAEAKRLGLRRPLVREVVVPATSSKAAALSARGAVADAVGAARVDAVFFGGSATEAAAFSQALTVAEVAAPMIGGDSLLDAEFLTQVGTLAAEGSYAVFPGAAPDELKSARALRTLWQTAGSDTEPGPYSANAYDAARAILLGFAKSIGDRETVTDAVLVDLVAALDETEFLGATGRVEFDDFGDAIDPPLSAYRLVEGSWVEVGVIRLG